MANFEKVYSIGFNTRKAIRSIEAFEKRIGKTIKTLDKLGMSVDKNMAKVVDGFRKARRAANSFDRRLRKLDSHGPIKDMSAAILKLQKDVELTGKKISNALGPKAVKPIARVSKRIESLGRKGARATRLIERGSIRASKGLNRMSVGAKRAGGSITGLITKIGLFIGAAQGIRSVVSNFMDFDRSMTLAGAKFSAINKDMAPGTEAFSKFRKEIRAAAVDTEHTAAAVAGAVDFWAKAGKTAKQTEAVIPVTLDFASANTDASGAALDMARAGDILSDALGQFQLDSADPTVLMANTARVADVMSRAANSANVSAEELFESFKTAGPVLTAVGSDIEDTSALLATMANAGIKGSIAGRQLKIATAALNAPTAKQTAMMEKYGIQVQDAEGNTNKLTNVIGQLDMATRELGTGERFEVFATLLGREGVTGFLNLVAKGEANINGLTDKLRGASGETKRLAEITRTSASAQMQKFWNQLTNIGFTIIEETKLFDKLGKMMESIDWKGVSKFITYTFIPGIMGVAKVISNFVIPVIEVLADALSTVLGPAIEVIAGRFTWLNDRGDSFKTKLAEIVAALPGFAQSIVTFMSEQFGGFVEMFQNTLWNMEELFNGFIRGTSREWETTVGHMSALGDVLLESYGSVFQELKALFQEVVSIFLGGTDDIEEDWYATGDRMGQDIADTIQFISAVIGTVAQTAAAVFSAVIKFVTVVVSEIRQIFTDLFGGIIDIAQGDFLTGISRVGIALADAITLPFRAAISGLLKLVSKIPGAEALADSFGIDLTGMSAAVGEGFSGLMAEDDRSINRSGTIDPRQPRVDFAPPEASQSIFDPQSMDMPTFDPFADQTVGTELQSALSQLDDNIQSIRQDTDVPLSPILSEQLKRQESADAGTAKFQQQMLDATQRQAKAKPSQVNVTVEGSSYTINAEGANAQEVGRIVRREMSNHDRRLYDGLEQTTRGVTFGEQ